MSSKVLIQLEWENDNFFEMQSKTNSEDIVQVIRMEENQHLSSVWEDYIMPVCEAFMKKKLSQIGDEMKA